MSCKCNQEAQEELKKLLLDFVSQVEYSELVTVENNLPHIRPMVYVNKGFSIYMASRKNANKVKHIRGNPHVSVVIIKSFSDSQDTREAIIEGRADIVGDETERAWVFDAFRAKPPAFQDWAEKEAEADFDIIRIKPRLIKYFDYSTKEPEPRILQFDC